MGSRGHRAFVTNRALPKNRRPNAVTRAGIIEEGSPAYWDLLIGNCRHWADCFDPEREVAWQAWRERIFQRWPCYRAHGRRPDAFDCFDLPQLAEKAIQAGKLTAVDFRAMSLVELVYRLDADRNERAQIEEQWLKQIEQARHGATPGAARRCAMQVFE